MAKIAEIIFKGMYLVIHTILMIDVLVLVSDGTEGISQIGLVLTIITYFVFGYYFAIKYKWDKSPKSD